MFSLWWTVCFLKTNAKYFSIHKDEIVNLPLFHNIITGISFHHIVTSILHVLILVVDTHLYWPFAFSSKTVDNNIDQMPYKLEDVNFKCDHDYFFLQ